jgi:D-alanyl-D-alanine carboxypeptidase (penicillin-binding protein 5/6)
MLQPRFLLNLGIRRRLPVAALVLWVLATVSGTLHAQSLIAVDVYNKKIHMERGAAVKRPVGGLAKVATALVVLDWADVTKVPLNTLATVSPSALQIAGMNTMGLQPGDQVTLRDLLYATMMTSDNVAATTLAAFVGQDILGRRGLRGDPVTAFVAEMNKLAAREGMTNTRFTNPHGLENSRTMPLSTAADMAKLAMYAVSRAPFRFYTTQKTRGITIVRMGRPQPLTLQNTNALLGVGTIDGMKTGNTPQSGGCIIATEERQGTLMKNAEGQQVLYRHRMVVVVLGSADPFGDGRALMQQGWNAYDNWLRQGRPVTHRQELLASFQ